jgi:hypothetical protein
LPFRLLEVEVQEEIDQDELDFVDSEEATRACLYTMAEAQVFLARRRRHVLGALSDQVLRDTLFVVPETVELFWIRELGGIESDGAEGEAKLRSGRDVCAVAEREGYFGPALGDNYEESALIRYGRCLGFQETRMK